MQKLDLFAKPMGLHLDGHYNIKTTMGGIISIISFIIIVLYTYLIGNDIFYRQSPTTYQENLTSNQTYSFQLKPNQSEFYFNLLKGDKTPFNDPTYLKLKLVYKKSVNSNPSIGTDLSMERCSRKNFPNYDSRDYYYSLYETIQIKEYYCPVLKNTVDIYGSWIEPEIQFVQLLVYPCNNKTDNVICKSKEEIDNVVWNRRIYLSIYYPIISVILNNFDSPFFMGFREDYYYLSMTDIYRFQTYAYELTEIKTDDGMILSNEKFMYTKSLKYVSSDQRNIRPEDPYFFSIDLFSSFNKKYYFRSYLKLTNILSQSGGMCMTIASLFGFLSSLFTKLERTKILIDKFFLFKNPDLGFDYELETLKTYNRFFNKVEEVRGKSKKGEFEHNAVFNLKVNNFVKKFFIKQGKKHKNIEEAMKEMQLIFELSKKDENLNRNLDNKKLNEDLNILAAANERRTIIDFRKSNLRRKSGVSLEQEHKDFDKTPQSGNKENINNYFLEDEENNLTNQNFISNNRTLKEKTESKTASPNTFKNSLSFSNNNERGLRKSIKYNENVKHVETDEDFKISPIIAKISNNSTFYNPQDYKDGVLNENELEDEENIKYINKEIISLDKEEFNFNNANKDYSIKEKIKDVELKSIRNDNFTKTKDKSKQDIKTNKTQKTKGKNMKRDSDTFFLNKGSTLHNANQNLSDIDIADENLNLDDQYKKYFTKLFEFRTESHKFYMNCWEQFYYNFLKRNKTKRSSVTNYNEKLFYLLDKCEKKIEDYFDFINILEGVQDAKILKEIILEEHQKALVDVYKRPLIYYQMENKFLSDFRESKQGVGSFAEEKVNVYSSLDVLFDKQVAEQSNNYNSMPGFKLNENLINFIRKAE